MIQKLEINISAKITFIFETIRTFTNIYKDLYTGKLVSSLSFKVSSSTASPATAFIGIDIDLVKVNRIF